MTSHKYQYTVTRRYKVPVNLRYHCTALRINSILLAATAAGVPNRRLKSPFRYIYIIQNSSETVLLMNVHYHRPKLYSGNPSILSKLCNCFQNLVLFTTCFGQPSHLQVIHNIYKISGRKLATQSSIKENRSRYKSQ